MSLPDEHRDAHPPWYVSVLSRPVVEAARALLGWRLTHATAAGSVTVELTEVEAYGGERDPASHAGRGRTPRNAVMFGPPGRLYVYFSYGMHWCANLVVAREGEASAVLLRAGRVVDGIDLARARRGPKVSDRALARGPACLTQALGIGPECNGVELVSDAVVQPLPGSCTRSGGVGGAPGRGDAGTGCAVEVLGQR